MPLNMLQSMCVYTEWANERLQTVLLGLTDNEADRDLGGSFNTIRRTVWHLSLAESLWTQRLRGIEAPVLPPEPGGKPFAEELKAWVEFTAGLRSFAEHLEDRHLESEIQYRKLDGSACQSRIGDIILHVCNHSTFHRGQLIHNLRQLGKPLLPNTDYITWCRGL